MPKSIDWRVTRGLRSISVRGRNPAAAIAKARKHFHCHASVDVTSGDWRGLSIEPQNGWHVGRLS